MLANHLAHVYVPEASELFKDEHLVPGQGLQMRCNAVYDHVTEYVESASLRCNDFRGILE